MAQEKAHQQPPESMPLQKLTVNDEQQKQVIDMAAPLQLGPNPSRITCPSCHDVVLTRMEFKPSSKTHIIALVLCLLGCFCCCCIPYCVDSCQSGNHYCPACGFFIGTYSG